jgi:hypothetical protein
MYPASTAKINRKVNEILFVKWLSPCNTYTDLGKPGQPGESGGNIHVICKEMMDAEKWTIISDGGDGSDGQNGVDGGTVPHRKWLKEDFMNAFPTMSTFDESSNEKAMEKVLKTLEEILPTNIRNFGQDILPGHRDHFFLQDTTKDGSNLTVAYYHKAKLGITTQRHTYILSKGNVSLVELYFKFFQNLSNLFNQQGLKSDREGTVAPSPLNI